MKTHLLFTLLTSLFASCVHAATFTVINTNAADAGSLQQAILDANATAGADVITFNIATAGLTISLTNALPTIVDPVTIDGSSQPGFAGTPIIEINGAAAGAGSDGLQISADNCVVRGLVINRFPGDGIEITNGFNNVVEGCYIGLNRAGLTDQGNTLNGILLTNAANNVIGGIAASNRNFIAGNNQNGIQIGGAFSTNNSVLGNYIGQNVNSVSVGNSADGIRVNAPRNSIGGSGSGAGNLISGNSQEGIEISSAGSGTTVRGNFIGTDFTGTVDRGNAGNGIFAAAGLLVIGGANPGEGNLVSGNNGDGIEINGVAATENLVLGNIIGANVNATANLRNNGHGVFITAGARSNLIGGTLAGQANVIAFNGADGISVAAATANTNNTLRGNSIFSNTGLGIDLGSSGVTLNDSSDSDTGANGLQNFPVLSSVTTNQLGEAKITGSLTTAPNSSYVVDFFVNAFLHSSGHGEGQSFLGSLDLTTDASGLANFVVSYNEPLSGRYFSATATDAFGNTSEFSRFAISLNENPPTNSSIQTADFVFIIDATSSMGGEIASVKSGLGAFVNGLNTNNIDARFAIVLFGGPVEIILDFTSDQATAESMFDLINVGGALAGIHNNHNQNPEAGLEAIRIVLNSASNNTLQRDHVSGEGPLAFRPEARKNLILVTDENSDLPFYIENRQEGQTGTEPPSVLPAPWQAEVDATAQAVIDQNAFLNLLIAPTATSARNQYGDPTQSVSDANFLNFNPGATLTNLVAAGFGSSLEAQVLRAGLVGRAFNISSVNTTNFVENFFAAKVEEIINNPPPPPRLQIAALPNAVRLIWPTNSPGFRLEANRTLTLTNGWELLPTNYSVLGTNYAVTNTTVDASRFYRLRR